MSDDELSDEMNRRVSERFESGKSVLPEADEKSRYADVMRDIDKRNAARFGPADYV